MHYTKFCFQNYIVPLAIYLQYRSNFTFILFRTSLSCASTELESDNWDIFNSNHLLKCCLHSVKIVFFFIEFLVSIISASFSCAAVCACCHNSCCCCCCPEVEGRHEHFHWMDIYISLSAPRKSNPSNKHPSWICAPSNKRPSNK